ncbi:MAG: glycosyltransferase family 2 protein [Paenibacillaceae bacterium]|nr:glycosyltransferase family 2 protein [Paenibacillaceae bacterium]
MSLQRTKPFVSIVICTYNRAELLRATLDSLLRLSSLDCSETIVVDNASTDATRSVAEAFIGANVGTIRARYVNERRQGLSAARNAGIRAACGDIVAFLDDDAIPGAAWLRTIAETFAARPDVAAIGGPIRPMFESGRPDWLIKPFEPPYTIVDLGDGIKPYPPHGHPFGANMAIRRAALERLPFPESLGRKGNVLLSGEETWLFGQLRRQGRTVLYHPDMEVDHFIPAARLTEAWIMKRYYYQGVTNGNLRGKLSAYGLAAAKAAYLLADSLFARSEGRKLLIACRRENIRGTLDTVRGRVAGH